MIQPLQIEVRDSLEGIPAVQWNALATEGNPFLRHEFLHTLDETGCLGQASGWYPRYFLVWAGAEEARDLIAAVPCYVKTNSRGEFVFDWSWAEAFERHQLDYYPKLVSAIPFTPVTGTRLLVRPDQPHEQIVRLLAKAVRQFADAEKYSSVHYLFITQAESDILAARAGNCIERTQAALDEVQRSAAQEEKEEATEDEHEAELPGASADTLLTRIDCQYHWHNDGYRDFEDFLSRCTSKRRKTIRRERRHVSDAGLRLEQRPGSTLSQTEWHWVHGLYESTYDRKWGSPSLTRAFFEAIGRKMGDRVLIVFAYDPADLQPDWPVACSIMFVGSSTLYGRYWGCRTDYNSLHFEACYYQGIDYCIANGLETFEPGAQGEHKITRGFVPTITRSAHYIRHPGFRDAIARYLAQERPHIEQRCTGLADLLPFKAESLSL